MKMIDHIFLDKRLKVKNTFVDREVNDFGYVSDHYPIMCEIEASK